MHTLCCKYDISSIFLFSPLRHRRNNGAILSALTTCLEHLPPCSQQPVGPGVRYPSGRVVDIPRKASLSASYKGGLTCTAMLHTKYYNNDLRGYSKCNIIRIISPPFLLHLSVRSRIIIFPSTRQSTPPSSSRRQLLDAHSLGSTWNS